MTEKAARLATRYRELIQLREEKGLTFSEIAIKKGYSRQYWYQEYVDACTWREKYGSKNNEQ